MIVTYKEKGWDIVTQRSHGILAAQIAYRWAKKDRPERWLETLLTVAEHDDAETELDGENLLTPAGGPLNYAMKQFDKLHCEKVGMLSITKSRFIALLTSMHMEFLYRSHAATDNEASVFLKQQEKMRKALQKELGIKTKELSDIYRLLEWCDAFSLLLCQGQLPPENRSIEISTGPDHVPYELFQVADGVLSVDPWPFEDHAFKVHFECRTLGQLQFESSAGFRKAFIAAPVSDVRWEIRKHSPGNRKPGTGHKKPGTGHKKLRKRKTR